MSNFKLLVKKDLLCLWRARQVLLATFSFALVLVVVASFSFRQVGFGQSDLQAVTPGILWLIFLFAGVIALNHSFLIETENDALQGLLFSKVDPGTVFLAKFSTNFVFLFAIQIFTIISHALLFGVEIFSVIPALIFITALAAIGFIAVGTLLSAISVSTPGRDLVLPLILFPLCIPLLAGAVFLTRELLQGGVFPWTSFWLVLILAYDAIALVLSWCLFEPLVTE